MTYEELKNKVKYHCDLYYNKYTAEISDAEFDKLYDTLLAVEKQQGWADADSPTKFVGGDKGKIKHPVPLYSLKKVYNINEVDSNFKIRTPKIDGANLTLIYNKGTLVEALTRGNGEYGDSVIQLAKEISNIPRKIQNTLDRVIINGECVTSNKVQNFRNYVSGSLALKSVTEFKQRNILFIAHDMLDIEADYTMRMSFLQSFGFLTVFDAEASQYPQDGIVFRIDSYEKSMELGYTAKYPRFAVALKAREASVATTTLNSVEWAIGRTGSINPIGIIAPVVLEDAVISRVTLHNIAIIEDFNLGLGDTIEIERAGGVIPKLIRVLEHSKHPRIDKAHAEQYLNVEAIRDGAKLYVKDKQVNSKKILEHFINTLGIKGLGPATLSKTGITTPEELFTYAAWDSLGAVGPKIQAEVEKAKLQPYSVVLAALGIPLVGRTVAKAIVSKIPKFKDLESIKDMRITNIGPNIVNNILNWLVVNEDWVYKLPLNLEQVETIETTLASKRVVITGKLDMSRSDLSDILASKGFKPSDSITRDCYVVISSGDVDSAKYKKAVQLGIPILDYWKNKKAILSGDF